MIAMMQNENLKKLSTEDKAFLTGFFAATDRAVSLLYNLKLVYMDNFVDVAGYAACAYEIGNERDWEG